ncbi:outer membrane beta-barrel family protein [Mucilaginibacter jinjuensis]|uniref:Outer membrane beta-barrel family protein n=1 Tax=Mucilaginibacter jinjuensis TaxID=1176721 RepID=A0ABY7TCW8_9SPHI|nr:outer membrane beta-barrel family protein [Mucilaginibacter jinjuensis]WCT14369.1 outer membrane beta-barrel family protein [Mucilaginibacter jinjuensis]
MKYIDPELTRDQLITSLAKSSTLSTRFGFNADLSKTTTFDGTFSLYIPLYIEYNRGYVQQFSSTSTAIDSTINSKGSDRLLHNHNNTVNLRLSHVLNAKKNEEIAFFLDINDYRFENNSLLASAYAVDGGNYKNELFNNIRDYKVRIYSVKSDYSIKVSKQVEMDAGAKVSFIKNEDNFDYTIQDNSLNDDLTKSDFNYKETVSAAYLNFVGSNKSFDYQFGGRLENTNSEGIAPLLNESLSKNYLNFFPAFTIQHNFKSKVKQQLVLSYNRRIIRPGYTDFNPNQNPTNRFTDITGQPDLKPQFLNNFELSYNISKLSITAYDSYKKNLKEVVPQSSDQGLVQKNQITSYSFENDAGININFPLTFFKWWSCSNTLTASNTETKLLDNTSINYFNYNVSSFQSFSIDKRNKFDLRIFYRPKSQINYGDMYEVTSLTAGYRTSILNDKLIITANINDILGRNKLSYYQDFGPTYLSQIALRNDRYFRIGLRYNFLTGNKFSIRNKRTKNDTSEIRVN